MSHFYCIELLDSKTDMKPNWFRLESETGFFESVGGDFAL